MVTKLAFDEGVFINPVIPPACAPQDTLVRVALMATHTKDQIDRAVEKLVKHLKHWIFYNLREIYHSYRVNKIKV